VGRYMSTTTTTTKTTATATTTIIIIIIIVIIIWNRDLEKLTGFQPVKKFLAFYGTRTFITTFTSALYLSLS